MKEQPKTLVYASSLFAWPCIQALFATEQLVGVITPDPQTMGSRQEPLRQLLTTLQANGIPFEVVCKQKLHLIPSHLPHFNADLALCLGFSHLLPQQVLNHYRLGIYNCHAAPLPAYGGRDPIYWQLRNQETHSALTWHAMTEQFDSGEILLQLPLSLGHQDTYASLVQRFAYLALNSLEQLFHLVTTNTVTLPAKVKAATSTSAVPELINLDFSALNATQIEALTRAHNGHYGRVLLNVKGMAVELIQASLADYPGYGTAAGTIVMISSTQGLVVNTQDGCIRLDIVACELGVMSAERLAQLIYLDAGEQLQRSPHPLQQQV
ncbi:methionyl-tRNA formyltransferase [Pseudoalteromonas sp. T1lg48]|uniref:methionyl-tRNA formyltransferase n=1 Tax=Pseudoalteromonas sp. T1lg48 TaxID=2077100 RepID=UPI000CF68D7B|nr:formyltransferase family protein [Pseudoalteromonas sp. T1lg48]